MPRQDFNSDFDYNAVLTVRKGRIENNPRGGTKTELKFRPSEGYDVLMAKLMTKVNGAEFNNPNLIDGHVWFMRTKKAAQTRFVKLSSENFEDQVKYRWDKISPGDISTWENEVPSLTAEEGFKFEFFMYIERRTVGPSGRQGIRRATVPQIRQSLEAIQQYEQKTGTRLGDITRQHLSVTHARQPEGTELTIPEDNTFRQAQFLDEQREVLRIETEAENNTQQTTEKIIRLKLNGQWIDVAIDLNSLRDALGLPHHYLFRTGIYNGYVHPQPAGDDVEDTDHADTTNNENDNDNT